MAVGEKRVEAPLMHLETVLVGGRGVSVSSDAVAACVEAGIPIHWRCRAWDREHFPHATRGYFPFWERIRAAG